MNTKGNSLDDVTERLVDAILSDHILQRDSLIPRVRAIIQAWVRVEDRPKNYDNIKTEKGILQRTVEQKNREKQFYQFKLGDIVGKDKMQPYYDELKQILIEEGFRKA